MFCDRCGANLQGNQKFCPNCGKPVASASAPFTPAAGRVAGHVRLLAILWLAMAAFRLVPALILLSIFRRGIGFWPPDTPMFVHGLLQMIGLIFLASAGVAILIAWGLLERRPWARMLAIVFAFLTLMEIPFGTALGVYTLWVLLPAKSEEEYRLAARAA